MSGNDHSKFETVISSRSRANVLTDFWRLLRRTKKWWLAPVLILLVALGAMMFAGGTAAAPFIYTLF